MSAEHHYTGKAFLPNLAPNVSPAFEPEVQTGRAVELGASNDLAVPIHHTLGVDKFGVCSIINSSTNLTMTDLGSNTYQFVNTNGSDFDVIRFILSETMADIMMLWDIDITVNSGSFTPRFIWGQNPQEYANFAFATGNKKIESTPHYSNDDALWIYCNTADVFDITITVNSVKQITNPNSYLSFHDIVNDEVIQIGNAVDGGSSKELVVNGTFDTDISQLRPTVGCSWDNGSLKIETQNTDNTFIGNDSAIQLVVGKTYLFKCEVINGTATAKRILLGTVYGGTQYGIHPMNSGGELEYEFIATTTNFYYTFQNTDGITSSTSFFDNVSVTEILPTGTTYTFNDTTINNILTHKTALDATSLANIQAEPNLLGDLALSATGTIPEVNITLDSTDKWFPCSEVE